MKHLKLAMICVGIAFVAMVATEAEAGWLKKPNKKPRTEKTEEEMKPNRPDYYPSMSFVGGVLSQEAHTGWKIGETPLYLAKDCVITMDGEEEGRLEEGRRATVMGVKVGEAISAWSIVVSRPDYQMINRSQSSELKEAGPNPNVGKIVQRAE